MKKNLLLAAALIFTATLQSLAQCTPDVSITKPLIPDSATNLPHAMAGQPYSTTIYLKVPATGVYSGMTVNIDSIQITSVSGLPQENGSANFSYICNTSSCGWPGNAFGCILLTGTPSINQARHSAVNSLTVNIMAYGKLFSAPASAPYTADDYKIVIDSTGTGIADIKTNTSFSVSQNTPNPFSTETSVEYHVVKSGMVSFKVFNLLGKEVFSTQFRAEAGRNKYNFKPSDMNPGIYMYSISSGGNTVVKRMILRD